MGNKRRENRNYCQRKRLYRGNQHRQDEEKRDLLNSEPNEIQIFVIRRIAVRRNLMLMMRESSRVIAI